MFYVHCKYMYIFQGNIKKDMFVKVMPKLYQGYAKCQGSGYVKAMVMKRLSESLCQDLCQGYFKIMSGYFQD